MPNDYFQFKQFRVTQAGVPMRVTTEGCLLGALVESASVSARVLDIGTGTGLLALMLAQRMPAAQIDAIEMDPQAAEQARTNFQNSPWPNRLKLVEGDIKLHKAAPYDLIISNPPFFANSLRSTQKPNQAKHEQTLTQRELASAVTGLSKPGTTFWVLYPPHEAAIFREMLQEQGWQVRRWIVVYSQPGKGPFRVIGCYIKEPNVAIAAVSEVLQIRDESGEYSVEFQRLLGPFYLGM